MLIKQNTKFQETCSTQAILEQHLCHLVVYYMIMDQCVTLCKKGVDHYLSKLSYVTRCFKAEFRLEDVITKTSASQALV